MNNINKVNQNEYIYLCVPMEYYCIYDKLLKLLSSLGNDMLNDCKASCNNSAKNIFTCWQMFQTACAAYSLNEINKADVIIKYINAQLQLKCPDIIRDKDKIVYFGDNNVIPSEEYIVEHEYINFNITKIFNAPFFNNINYIVVPKNVTVHIIENTDVAGEYLYNKNTGDDLYVRVQITINNEPYILWYCELIEPLNANIKVLLKEEVLNDNTIIYYNDSNEKPKIIDILQSNIIDYNVNKIILCPSYKNAHYFAIPKGINVNTIENHNFKGDWLYNKQLNIDLYTKEDIIIQDKEYTLWYCKFLIPINSNIEIKLI